MSDVIDLAAARAARRSVTVHHPSLRWVIDGDLHAHRRGPRGMAACGKPGPLSVLAGPGMPLCPKCYKVATLGPPGGDAS